MQHMVPKLRRIVITVGAVIPALMLAACGSSGGGTTSGGNGSYKVALIADISGPFSGVAGPGAAGAEAAVSNINAAGGINGHKINLDVIDAQSNASAALAAAQKAVAGNPLAIMMFSGSAGASSITSLVQSAHVPFLTPALADSAVYPPQPYLYQPSLTAKQDAEAIVGFIKQKSNGNIAGKTVDVAAISSPYVDVIVDGAKRMLTEAGAKIGSTERYQLPLASFATQAGTIARDKPDVVLTLGSTDDTPVVSKALTAAGVSAIQIGIPSGAAQATLQQIRSANYYALTANPYPNALVDFLAIADKYGKKDTVSKSIFSMSGWVTAYAVSEALKHCANCDSAGLNSALQQVSNFTVPNGASYGPVTFSGSSHVGVTAIRFHNYNPATGTFSESDPITVQ